jgi:hypothetical protein
VPGCWNVETAVCSTKSDYSRGTLEGTGGCDVEGRRSGSPRCRAEIGGAGVEDSGRSGSGDFGVGGNRGLDSILSGNGSCGGFSSIEVDINGFTD